MILLQHLKKCSSIKNCPDQLDLSSRMPFCIDTRKYQHPSAFVAIPGSKVNPLDMLTALLNQGCPLVVYQDDSENEKKITELQVKHPLTSFLAVSDAVTFLQELSHQHIKHWKSLSPLHTVFAISGSNGKTTHKEMLSFILKSLKPHQIVATEKNNNNHLGVPLTLLQVTDETQMVVLELGSNHPGEIKVLCDIAAPNAGLTTNIGATHLEFFENEHNVFLEEGFLYHAVKDGTEGKGFYLINRDDPYLKNLPPFPGAITYGESMDSMAVVSFLENGAVLNYQGQKFTAINDHITGKHNKLNLITCVFIAQHFFPDHLAAILRAAAEFRPTKNRSEWLEFEGKQVYLDAYNANPSSMKAALAGFKESLEEQGLGLEEACVVLGDMNELGDSSARYHEEVGAFIKELKFKHVYFIGRFSPFYLKGFPEGHGRPSADAFKTEYRSEILKKLRIHFIKGSRSLQLESLFDIT